ncbi:MAG: pyruvate:ferredoxin (flavodoxin) oxidoreductase [Clostridium tyrobutyricum]|uniref:pyruvate:ferredoxin (flavodoxin) oxidoreductase n=1 Tax=Clostridium tyrobutyricum TaxID=1519 RepID=UPI00242A9322|nr:pyruvate:ferredoxin (flavodoxin) oxidoreductase [Clostridium tyrobutyricum]MCH4199113.1 pyruvate:ferredoxin (flavodoxin) oxidoreductase [Clostridium tyrobutyricum]MCH4237150.1 pyruvate:ferredoxin (flavodoxin) oxidoreductase [Clostridium tyrobutyricum]MCH4259647.1 pyruvate:ferredoxin (flavodoxin) oxidoreductase [Clostridium tyrobutyricum]MCI1240142.1 pyruvate:ferredoxin (flavodoxin) oxidoreductase [Clostridium tyrobutyricum]MCI1651602.1 pyruvate:ferredoxin (flavodoxin) oxidoreductase [Clostr
MSRSKQSMDGNTAAAHVAYAFTEVAGIYPITPSSPMADVIDQWSAAGRENIFGNQVNVVEMESEAGAAGTVHGSLAAGAITTTFTASQGLLLMIPNMYKIAAEQLPCVFDVSARTVATQSLNIFGDHSDVYACRQTGFAMLAETNPQEVMDLSPVAHLSAIEGKVPFINFFDGFRTSHEIQKIEKWDYEDLKEMCNMDAVKAFREHALNPEHPAMRGSHENGDVFFQHREASNTTYDKLPAVVEKYMAKVNEKLGTNYDLFNYYGAPDADRVIIAMGSICDVAEEVIDYLTARGEKIGIVKVRLYRPWVSNSLLKVLPKTAKKVAVLDRTKEPGALGDPLYLDVATTLREAGLNDVVLTAGRYGLGSKDTPPSSVFAVYTELKKDAPKARFTIGIVDDVTNLSLPEVKPAPITSAPGTVECKFWGLGGDGTVGANKNSTKILGDHTDKYIQAYFQYDSKKTGGVTISHLRFGDKPIRSPYYINQADFVACHNPSYVVKGYKMVQDVKPGGTFMINCQWSDDELDSKITADSKKYIADNNIQLYTINAIDKAIEIGMGKRTNTILQSAFFKLANVMPIDDAVKFMKAAAKKSYGKKGDAIVEMNYKAIDAGVDAVHKIDVPASWKNPAPDAPAPKLEGRPETVKMVKNLMNPITLMDGDSLPVSAFEENPDGQFEIGAAAYEKRGTAVNVPEWDPDKCIQCNSCSFVCSHATIRPFMLSEAEVEAAPSNIKVADTKPKAGKFKFTMSVTPLDCMGCGECITVCPTKAIKMVPQESQLDQQPVFDYLVANVGKKPGVPADTTVKGSQFNQPLLEFSGSCAGCAETSYARLLTQLFGEHMYISNATGCSSIWGGPAATSPFTVNKDSNMGPAWANSLFEDNAEHGFGMYLGQKTLRDQAIAKIEKMAASDKASDELKAAAKKFIETKDSTKENTTAANALVAELEKAAAAGCDTSKELLASKQYLAKKSVWILGGDGWAYDIGFGGLDHVLASGENVNVMVFDTEMYSNTGGQASKASNIGEVCQFAAAGKEVGKKSLAEIAMSYGYVYVAQIALGANPAQTVKTISEAEAYNGPSLIIGYAPCELHGVKGGMNHCQDEMKKAVKAGYWNLFSFNPLLKAEGKNPFTLTSKPGDGTYQDFLNNETRYTRLKRAFPDRAEKLFDKSEESAKERYDHLLRLVELYK